MSVKTTQPLNLFQPASGVNPSKTELGKDSFRTSSGSVPSGSFFVISSLSLACADRSNTRPSSWTIAVVWDLRPCAALTRTVATHKGVGSDQMRTEAPLARAPRVEMMDMPAARGCKHRFAPKASRNCAPATPKIVAEGVLHRLPCFIKSLRHGPKQVL